MLNPVSGASASLSALNSRLSELRNLAKQSAAQASSLVGGSPVSASSAKEEIIASDPFGSASAALGFSGVFAIGSSAYISVQPGHSLTDIMNMINGANAGVSASINNQNQLLLSGLPGAGSPFMAADTSAPGYTTTNSAAVSLGGLISNTNWSDVVSVSQIAKAQQDRGSGSAVAYNNFGASSAISDPNAALNYEGSFTLAGTSFSVAATDSLNDIANAVNGANISVSASIGAGNRLTFTSKQTGAAYAFSASDNTVNSKTFSSSNTFVASADSLVSDVRFSDTVNVAQLAVAEQVRSYNYGSSTKIGTNGSFDINGVTINVSSNNNIRNIRDAINSAGAGATASVSGGRLYITSSATGTANALSFSDPSSILQTIGILNGSGNKNVNIAAKDAKYTVNGGGTITSSYNAVTLQDGSGANAANVTLKSLGSSVVSNVIVNSVLQDLGVLNGSGGFANPVQAAQDAKYTVNGGGTVTSGSNSVTIKNASGADAANVTLNAPGTATVSNYLNVLYSLGVTDQNGRPKHVVQDTSAGASAVSESPLSDFAQSYNRLIDHLNRNGQYFDPKVKDKLMSALSAHSSNLRNIGFGVRQNGMIDFSNPAAAAANIGNVSKILDDAVNSLNPEVLGIASPSSVLANSAFLKAEQKPNAGGNAPGSLLNFKI